MISTENEELRGEFEYWLCRYRQCYPQESKEFERYLFDWHRNNMPSEGIGEAVSIHIRNRAMEQFPNNPFPSVFLRYLFHDFPEPRELQSRFESKKE